MAVAHNTTPFFSVYGFSGSGFGSKLTNPVTLPTGAGLSVAFSEESIAVGHATTPFVSVYPWEGNSIGAKFSNPSTLPSQGQGIAFGRIQV
jgi:hypothetical protein